MARHKDDERVEEEKAAPKDSTLIRLEVDSNTVIQPGGSLDERNKSLGCILATEWCEELQLLILCMVDRSVRLLKVEGYMYMRLMFDEVRFEEAAERGPNCCYRCPFMVQHCISTYSATHRSHLLLLQGTKHFMLVRLPSMEVVSKYLGEEDNQGMPILDVPEVHIHAPVKLKERPNSLLQLCYSINGLFVFLWQANQ